MDIIDSAEAEKLLDDLLASRGLRPELAAKLRDSLSKLHTAGHRSAKAEVQLSRDAKLLTRTIELQNMRGDTSDAGSSIILMQLKDDKEQAEGEKAMLAERNRLLQVETKELTRAKDDLERLKCEIIEERRKELQPMVDAVRHEMQLLQESVILEEDKLEGAVKEAVRLRESMAQIVVEVDALGESRRKVALQYARVADTPETARKQAEVIETNIKSLVTQERQLAFKVRDLESKYGQLLLRTRELEGKREAYRMERENQEKLTSKQEQIVSDFESRIELQALEQDELIAEQLNFDLKIKGLEHELRRDADLCSSRVNEKQVLLRRLKKEETILKELQDSLAPLRGQLDQIKYERSEIESEKRAKIKDVEALTAENKAFRAEVLKADSLTRDAQGAVSGANQETFALEAEVMALKKQEMERDRLIADMASQRDRTIRLRAIKIAKWREAVEMAQVKDIVLRDLKKERKEVTVRVKEFQQLYDLVKNQRNKFVNLIQAASQSISEMREKLKILGNEIELLREESSQKDLLLSKNRHEHTGSRAERDALRNELNVCAQDFKQRQSEVDEQISQIDQLNSLINQAEKAMLRLKKQYETMVEARNYTGLMLIDRNDELCILYEKLNLQEGILRTGELELSKREDEIRLIRIEISELERSKDLLYRHQPEVPRLDVEIAAIKLQLLEARAKAAELSDALENPENQTRWRRLEGKIPDKEELQAKIIQLEERLNDRKEQLLEKELILEEVANLSERLRQQAAEGRADTLDMASTANDLQQKIRTVTRKIMATVSELSMFQAAALKLEADRQALEATVQTAAARLERGEPPTEEMEAEWLRMERQERVLLQIRDAQQELSKLQDLARNGHLTTAPLRPNAYISGDTALPAPFGAFPPAKPSEPGATMRHIRKPQPREIVI